MDFAISKSLCNFFRLLKTFTIIIRIIHIIDGKARGWVKEEGMLIKGEAVKEISKLNPRIVIIGLGYEGSAKLDYSAEFYLGKGNAKVFAERTKDAVAHYNRIQGSGVVAALHIT